MTQAMVDAVGTAFSPCKFSDASSKTACADFENANPDTTATIAMGGEVMVTHPVPLYIFYSESLTKYTWWY